MESQHCGIELVEYDPRWRDLFQREAQRIWTALGDCALCIEHTGSTSVPGLAAKPTIDILLVVADSAKEGEYSPALQRAGYRLLIREPAWHQDRMFKGPDTDVNLHVLSDRCPEIERILAFRNRLRKNAGDRELYARTKRELSRMNWKDVQSYADAKTTVIEEILARARVSVHSGG